MNKNGVNFYEEIGNMLPSIKSWENPQPQAFGVKKLGDITYSTDDQYLIDGLLYADRCALLYALPKSNKSYFVLYLAIHIAAGRNLFNKIKTRKGRVLIFNAEDPLSMSCERAEMLCQGLGIDYKTLDIAFVDVGSLYLDNHKHIDQLRETIKDYKPDLVILDPLRNMNTLDENDSRLVPLVLNPLRQIQRDFHTAILLIHHTIKAPDAKGPTRIRGSSALRGWYDTGIEMTKDDKSKIIDINLEHRMTVTPEPLSIKLVSKSESNGCDFELLNDTAWDGMYNVREQFKACYDKKMTFRAAIEHLRNIGISFGNNRASAIWKELQSQ